jgi:hypothetical protein
MHHDFAGKRQDVEVEWDSHGTFRGMLLSDFVQTEASNWLLCACRVSAEPTKHFQLAMGGGAKRLGVGAANMGKNILGLKIVGHSALAFTAMAKMRTTFQKDCCIY